MENVKEKQEEKDSQMKSKQNKRCLLVVSNFVSDRTSTTLLLYSRIILKFLSRSRDIENSLRSSYADRYRVVDRFVQVTRLKLYDI